MMKRSLSWVLIAGLILSGVALQADSYVAPRDANIIPSGTELIRRNLEANGGAGNIEKLQSLLANGVLREAGMPEESFKLYRKRPDRVKYVGEVEGVILTIVFDGERAWAKVSNAAGQAEVMELTGSELLDLKRSSLFEDQLLRRRYRPETVKPVAIEFIDGERAVRVELTDAEEGDYGTIWISADHYQPIKMQRTLPGEEGAEAEAVVEEVFLSEYEKVDGVYLPMRLEEWRNGEKAKVMKTETVKTNVGIFDSFFSEP